MWLMRMPRPMRGGRASACPPRQSGSLPPAVGWIARPTRGVMCGWKKTGAGGATLSKDAFPMRMPRWMDFEASLQCDSMRPTGSVSTMWPAMSGSGAAIGTVRILTDCDRSRARSFAIRADPPTVWIRTNPASPSEFIGVDPSSVATSTAPVSLSVPGARVRWTRAVPIWVSGVFKTARARYLEDVERPKSEALFAPAELCD